MLRASVRLGAWCGAPQSASQAAALDQYSAAVGLAFQVVDDVLDVEADSATLGKTAGKDAEQDKPTFVSLLGLSGARSLAASLREQAHAALDDFGGSAAPLRALADLIVLRRS
jgi:farnesyl diphosphate synthase